MSPVIASALMAAGICFADEPPAPTADVNTILEKWAAATPVDAKIEVDFTRFEYDHVFKVETLNAGTFEYDPPSNRRVKFLKVRTDRNRVSSRRDKETGEPYQIDSDRSEIWEQTVDVLRRIGPEPDSVTEVPLSELGGSAAACWEVPLVRLLHPMVMSGDIARLKSSFEIRVSNSNESEIELVLDPISQHRLWKTDSFQIRLDPVTYRTTAARQFSPSGQSESIYVFKNWKIEHAADETTKNDLSP